MIFTFKPILQSLSKNTDKNTWIKSVPLNRGPWFKPKSSLGGQKT